jgi:fluoroquinolone transport system permease protein
LEDFSKVELFKDIDSIKDRVEARDHIVGIIPEGDSYYMMTQGNEPQGIVDYAKALEAFYTLDIQIEDSNATIHDFGRTVPPLKQTLVNSLILMMSVIGGMFITLNIVEEKVDNTISAINLTPTTRKTFILGKSMLGLLFPIYGAIVTVLLTGFTDINFLQIILIALASSLISLLLGFIQGIHSDDAMSAIAGLKLLILPLAASVIAIEILGDTWQKFFYWSPFYWAYKGNQAVLSQTGTWGEILFYTGMVLALSAVVYFFLAPRIRKGLE